LHALKLPCIKFNPQCSATGGRFSLVDILVWRSTQRIGLGQTSQHHDIYLILSQRNPSTQGGLIEFSATVVPRTSFFNRDLSSSLPRYLRNHLEQWPLHLTVTTTPLPTPHHIHRIRHCRHLSRDDRLICPPLLPPSSVAKLRCCLLPPSPRPTPCARHRFRPRTVVLPLHIHALQVWMQSR
jgi:hypothetical protein